MRRRKLFTKEKAKNGEGRQAVIKHLLLPEDTSTAPDRCTIAMPTHGATSPWSPTATEKLSSTTATTPTASRGANPPDNPTSSPAKSAGATVPSMTTISPRAASTPPSACGPLPTPAPSPTPPSTPTSTAPPTPSATPTPPEKSLLKMASHFSIPVVDQFQYRRIN